jgi:hypothetical protein
MVTDALTAPEVMDKVVISGVTVKLTLLLATPETVTTTFPVVAALGTVTTIVVGFQLLELAEVPLNATVPDEPKFVPVIVTEVPTGPLLVERLVIDGAAATASAVKCARNATATISFMIKAKPSLNIILVSPQTSQHPFECAYSRGNSCQDD